MVSYLWLKDNCGYFVGNAIEKRSNRKVLMQLNNQGFMIC